jgi:hypothetical protein
MKNIIKISATKFLGLVVLFFTQTGGVKSATSIYKPFTYQCACSSDFDYTDAFTFSFEYDCLIGDIDDQDDYSPNHNDNSNDFNISNTGKYSDKSFIQIKSQQIIQGYDPLVAVIRFADLPPPSVSYRS